MRTVRGVGAGALRRLRSAVLLTLSVSLILGLGGLAAWGHLTTASRVTHAQRADRLHLQKTLSSLTGQYLQFGFLDTLRAARSERWQLRPGSAVDRAGLQRAVAASALTTYGATLVTTDGVPLTSYAPRGLPSPVDPGLRPLRTALVAGKPGLSDVLHVGDAAVVAFAVPVMDGGEVTAVLIAYADVRTWPLQGYDATIDFGATAEPYVLDAHGTVTASGSPEAVGTRLEGLPSAATAGGTGLETLRRDGRQQVVSYGPAGFGWTAVTVQDEQAFSGGLPSRSRRDAVALVVLLTFVVLLLLWFNHTRQRALRRLADERLHDALTGLPQRRLFSLRLDAALARHRRSGAPVTLLYCDLDGFKQVNDAFGHNAGDQLLVEVAQRMRAAIREEDQVARLGGDEFAVVVEGADLDEARAVAQRLRDQVGKDLALGGDVLRPQVSIGLAVLRDPSRSADLVAEADLAMYRVKHGQLDAGEVVLDRVVGPVVPAQAAAPDEAERAERRRAECTQGQGD